MYYILLNEEFVVLFITKTLEIDETTGYYLIQNKGISVPKHMIYRIVELGTLPSNAFSQVCKFIDGEFVPYVSEIERIRHEAQEELMNELIEEGVI